MTLALPVSAEPEFYFGEVETLEDGYKVVSLIVKDINNLGSCDAIIEFTKSGVEVRELTSGDGNALTMQTSDIDNTEGSVKVTAWDVSTGHSGDVVICNIVYTGSDSVPFKINSAELFDYDSYGEIQHTGNNDIDRSTATKVVDGEGVVTESTGEDNKGIPGFGLFTGLSVMLIAVRLLHEDR